MAGLFCNATLSFTDLTCTQIKGFSVYRRGDPKYSAADLSNWITFQASKNRIDVLTVETIDPRILKLEPGDTGTLTLTAKTADGVADLVFAGSAMVVEVQGIVQFAEVESPCSATFSIISADGQAPNMGVTGGT
jgi:hypothetical protein